MRAAISGVVCVAWPKRTITSGGNLPLLPGRAAISSNTFSMLSRFSRARA
jgi:hypothetical protein